ncbi:MAG: NAD(P)/FAD-dependent oxidoreductase [Pigmentiphaga sp.]|nr:NAD(P)/FAD-dependent oxidoreductase [Pigmentiphaga sp.]
MQVIVIGSGINGLVAAASLALKGRRVTVLERLDRPGGAVRTEALTLPGFRHDVAAMNLSMFAGSAFHAAHGEVLRRHGLALVPVDRPFASAFPDGGHLGVSTHPGETLASFSLEADRKAWEAQLAMFPAQAAALGSLLSAPMTRRGLASAAWRIWRARGSAGSLELLRLLASSPRAWAERTFRDPRLHAALCTWGLHLDFAPDVPGGAIFPYLEGLAGQAMGMVIGQGGADTVTRALIGVIESAGGGVRCSAEVERIGIDGGRATGVALAGGEKLEAESVVANLTPRRLAMLLPGGSGDARYDAGLREFRYAPGTMMIHLAMRELPPWRAEALRRFAYVHLAPAVNDLARTYQQASAGLLPDAPVLVVGQPTVFDPGRAPNGRHVLWIQVRCVPAVIEGDAAGRIAGRDWPSVQNAYADRVLDQIAAYAPGLHDHILARRVVSPLELEAENPNLVGGDQVSGSHHPAQNFMFRPVWGYADGGTPIRGLYQVGASVWPGAGTGAGSGWLVSQRL